MHMSNESLLIIVGVGLIAGWLAGQIVQGTGFGIVGEMAKWSPPSANRLICCGEGIVKAFSAKSTCSARAKSSASGSIASIIASPT